MQLSPTVPTAIPAAIQRRATVTAYGQSPVLVAVAALAEHDATPRHVTPESLRRAGGVALATEARA